MSLTSLGLLLLLIELHHGQAEEELEAYLTLQPHSSPVYPGDEVTLRCGIKNREANEWTFGWKKDEVVLKDIGEEPEYKIGLIGWSDIGKYECFGRNKQTFMDSEWSDSLQVTVLALPRAGLTISPNPAYSGETVTLTCTVESGFGWSYRWFRDSKEITEYRYAVITITAAVSVQGQYSCQGKKESRPISSSPSDTRDLSVNVNKPMATTGSDKTTVFTGHKVTLTCSVGESSGWRFYWYRHSTGSDPVSESTEGLYTFTPSSVSEGGEFWCRGGRGNPVYLTEYSQPIIINVTARPYAVITMQPNWTHIFVGETVTLHCDVKGTDDFTDWKYIWYKNGVNMEHNSLKDSEYRVRTTTLDEPGAEFTCKGVCDLVHSDTSEVLTLTVSGKPDSVLRVSPSWLNPGDSVTLTCEVEVSSTDWRFYWYRTVPYMAELPSLAVKSYSEEPLLDSDHGTGESSYILHGATHTAGYVCRAGRGRPVYHSYYSERQFLWSGDQHPSVSLTVNPNRTQHFTSESVSLSCEGNSTGWKVMSNTTYFSRCSNWDSMTGCTFSLDKLHTGLSGVYWCESGSGEYSNAVNITVTLSHVILESPVHPVTEGDSVTLRCKHRNPSPNSKADFYKDGGLIQNGTSGEMTIPAVSKSHEGLYRCRYSDGEESPESWLVVRASDSRTPLSDLFMGLVVFGLLLVLLLFLIPLFCYQKGACFGKRSGSMPSQGTNQSPGLDLRANQNPPPSDDGYSPPPNGGTNVYEAIKATETNDHDGVKAGPIDVTYSELQLKNFGKQKKAQRVALVEETVYSDVRTAAAPESSTPVRADCVYAEVKKGSTLGQTQPEHLMGLKR